MLYRVTYSRARWGFGVFGKELVELDALQSGAGLAVLSQWSGEENCLPSGTQYKVCCYTNADYIAVRLL